MSRRNKLEPNVLFCSHGVTEGAEVNTEKKPLCEAQFALRLHVK